LTFQNWIFYLLFLLMVASYDGKKNREAFRKVWILVFAQRFFSYIRIYECELFMMVLYSSVGGLDLMPGRNILL